MRGRRLGGAVFLVATGIAGARILTDTPDSSQTVRVDAPVSQPVPPGDVDL